MAFVLQEVIEELEESRCLEPLKKIKKRNPGITPGVSATKSFHIPDLI